MITTRHETPDDYTTVENIIRQSFYNVYMPGCYEHYLAHIIRQHEDFIHELDFVLEKDGKIIGQIMYTKAKLIDENKNEKVVLTFGPVCILPEYQKQGYGKRLIEHSMKEAYQLGYDTIVILGNPGTYVRLGFQSCKDFHVSLENGKYPTALLVKTLVPHVLDHHSWTYYESPAMAFDPQVAKAFDDSLEKMEKKHLASQDEFAIISRSFIE